MFHIFNSLLSLYLFHILCLPNSCFIGMCSIFLTNTFSAFFYWVLGHTEHNISGSFCLGKNCMTYQKPIADVSWGHKLYPLHKQNAKTLSATHRVTRTALSPTVVTFLKERCAELYCWNSMDCGAAAGWCTQWQ